MQLIRMGHSLQQNLVDKAGRLRPRGAWPTWTGLWLWLVGGAHPRTSLSFHFPLTQRGGRCAAGPLPGCPYSALCRFWSHHRCHRGGCDHPLHRGPDSAEDVQQVWDSLGLGTVQASNICWGRLAVPGVSLGRQPRLLPFGSLP